MKNRLIFVVIVSFLVLSGIGCSSSIVVEETIIINKGSKWELEGTLTLPSSTNEPYPCVILVQGSGPQDRDETIYDNKPFKDISDALNQQGIAVLRYDKRTYTHAKTITEDKDIMNKFTVEEEVIQDAIAARKVIQADKRIDQDNVYIIGHSLGGMLAPRIDQEGGDFKGIIIMAGSPRTLREIVIDQITAQVEALPESQKQLGEKQLTQIVDTFTSLDTMSDEAAMNVQVIGASGYYFKEMEAHPAITYLENNTKPMLVLQGDKDFQIYPSKDFEGYKTILKDKQNIDFKLYPGLNHLFIKSTTQDANEYKTKSKVDSQVTSDIADWIHRHSK